MAHFNATLETPASCQAAFDYLADFSNCQSWDPSVSRARLVSGGPIGAGSRFEVFLALAGRELRFDYEITRFEPSRCLVLRADTPLVRSLDTLDFEPRPNGCRIRYDADLRPRGAAYLLDLPIHLAFQVSGTRSVRGLERALAQLA